MYINSHKKQNRIGEFNDIYFKMARTHLSMPTDNKTLFKDWKKIIQGKDFL
jgi:hypothetical protein